MAMDILVLKTKVSMKDHLLIIINKVSGLNNFILVTLTRANT